MQNFNLIAQSVLMLSHCKKVNDNNNDNDDDDDDDSNRTIFRQTSRVKTRTTNPVELPALARMLISFAPSVLVTTKVTR